MSLIVAHKVHAQYGYCSACKGWEWCALAHDTVRANLLFCKRCCRAMLHAATKTPVRK